MLPAKACARRGALMRHTRYQQRKETSMKSKYGNVGTAVAALMTLSVPALAQDIDTGSGGSLTANAAFSNNYIWRGLTQTMNEPAISGGVDYAADNGFYVGTWASNVSYAPS